MSKELDEATRQILRSVNPFDETVRPQYPDGRFPQIHVPAVLREPREQLLRAIDAYRVPRYNSLVDLPPSRIVTVLGDRGAGKTHLLESLLYREDGRPQILINRDTENYEENIPFEEYLLQLLLRALRSYHPVYRYQFFEALAGQLTRTLLLHTLRELGPTDRLFTFTRSRRNRFRLLWGGGETIAGCFDALADELENAAPGIDLARVIEQYQLNLKTLGRFTLARLNRHEAGTDISSIIRREFYGALVRATLLSDVEALDGFLEADYLPQTRDNTVYRPDVVRHLLNTVVEACALVRLPVVFSFDNLEGLLAPSGTLNPLRAMGFLDGLGQAVDHTRGFLFLLFFEGVLFNETIKVTGTFARSRLQQGVKVPGHCGISQLELMPPTSAELIELIKGRMKPIRDQFPDVGQFPDYFPFSSAFVEQQFSLKGQPLRGMLERLRGEYNRLAFGWGEIQGPVLTPKGGEAEKETEKDLILERAWDEALSMAGQALGISLADQGRELTNGLGMLLQALLPLPEEFPPVGKVYPALPVGDIPRYGFATLLEFASGNSFPTRVAVGLLLAGSRGLALDLRAKLAVFSDDKTRANFLIVLWPTSKKADDLASALPGKTREVWEEAGMSRRACLRRVELATLRKILAVTLLEKKLRTKEVSLAPESLKGFLQRRCGEVIPLVIPPPGGKESKHGNPRTTTA